MVRSLRQKKVNLYRGKCPSTETRSRAMRPPLPASNPQRVGARAKDVVGLSLGRRIRQKNAKRVLQEFTNKILHAGVPHVRNLNNPPPP